MSVRSAISRRSSRRSVSSTSSSTSSGGIEMSQMLSIEKKYPQFIDKSFDELEELKSILSENQEFDKFIAIQTYIDFRKKENTSYLIAVFKKWLQEGINEAASNFDFNISLMKEQLQNEKRNIINECERSLAQLNEKQLQEIEKLKSDKTFEINREKQRKSYDVRKLLNLSQKYAHVNEPDLAKKVQNEAKIQQKNQFEQKQFQIGKKYDQMIKQIQQKYTNDTQAVKMKYNTQLDTIQTQYSIETEEQKKRLLVFILFLQQKAITDGSKELIRKEKKTKFTNEITNYVSNHVFDIGKGFIFDGIEP